MTTKAPTRPRRTQAERSASMRDKLSKAAFEVIKEIGFANFRTSAVSKKAGVSQGAQLHHFPTKASLTIAAMEYAYAQANKRFTKNFKAYKEGDDIIAAVIKDAKDFYMSEYFMVALDILMAGGKDQNLRDEQVRLALESRVAIENAWHEKLEELNWDSDLAQEALGMTFCLVRGFAIRMLIAEEMDTFNKMMTRWHSMLDLARNSK